MKIVIELYNALDAEYREVHLPMNDISRLRTFGNPCFDKHIFISSHKGTFPYDIDCCENILLLNNLLLKIAALPTNEKNRVRDYFSLLKKKDFISLQTAFSNRLHFEIFNPDELSLSEKETQRRCGEYFLLQVIPDIMTTADGLGMVTPIDATNGFNIGVRSKSILYNEGKYYVLDNFLLQQSTNEDLDFIEQIIEYNGGFYNGL